MSTVTYPHIEVNETGVPIIAGSKTKVVEIVLDRLAHHWDADEIQRQHPHLSLSQIHAALAYYYDHQAEIDADIAQRLAKVAQIEASQTDSVVRAKLRLMGKLP